MQDDKTQPLAVPDLRKRITASRKGIERTLDCRNENAKALVTCLESDTILWKEEFDSMILLMTLSTSFSACSTLAGALIILSRMGRRYVGGILCFVLTDRVLLPIVLDACISFLESSGKFLLAITTLGTCFVWYF